MLTGIIDVFAEYERDVIKARTKAALQAMKREGKRVGHIPFGYRLAPCGVYLENRWKNNIFFGTCMNFAREDFQSAQSLQH